MKKPEAIIFDMDGVIFDTEFLNEKIERDMLSRHGIDQSLFDWNDFRGMPAKSIFTAIVEKSGTSVPVQTLIDEMTDALTRLSIDECIPFPHALETLRTLSETYPLALVTSSLRSVQKHFFNVHDMHDLFSVIVTGDDIKIGKPDPEPYLRAVKLLDQKPERCTVVEDSVNGVMSSHAAGCFTVGITHTHPAAILSEHGADIIVEDFVELSNAINK